MLHFNKNLCLYLILFITSMSCSAKSPIGLKAEKYVISSEKDMESRSLADLAFNKLQQYTDQKDIVLKGNSNISSNYKTIYFEVSPNSTYDYCLHLNKNNLSVTLKNKKDAAWIISQIVEEISTIDDRFKATDLPPSTIKFSTNCNNFDFSYRDPHYASNLIPGNSLIFGNNSVDLDWGIWGHNLAKVMKDINDTNIYALVNDVRNIDQFSFSSPELINHLTQYILYNFGDGKEKGYHFMIMPQDNNLVCLCEKCKNIGNTKNNATPAVSYFIRKMADKFPKHKFFTSSYNTTIELPKEKLNDNTGVFLSTITLKKGVDLSISQPKTAEFIKDLKSWEDITENIYIWDYSANFDDYLTPIPVLYSLQKQLRFYKNYGVKGVFLNASGYDYTSFGNLKTFIAGALLKNTEVDIDMLCSSFFKKYYPQNHELLTNYYLTLEKSFAKTNKTYTLYAGINEISSSYLDVGNFIKFYQALKNVIPETNKEEKEKLEKLYTALSYTKLQIAYNEATGIYGCAEFVRNKLVIKPEIKKILNNLSDFPDYGNLNNYKEANGALNKYIDIWKNKIINKRFENLLFNETITILSDKDEGFEDTQYLNNGLPGFDHDYHQGWYISSKDLKVRFSVEKIDGEKSLNFSFMNNDRHGFYPPIKIEVWGDNKLINTTENVNYDTALEAIDFSLTLNLTDIRNIEVLFTRRELEKSKIACDEIRLLN